MRHKEIEYKYWAGSITKEDLQSRIEEVCLHDTDIPSSINSFYVVSCDDYYTKDREFGKDFIRFRKGGGRYELTLKRKEDENLVRSEVNLNVSDNDDSSIVEFLRLSGYKKAFQVYKEAWIWESPNCDISYYTLSDGRSVIELEATSYNTVKEGIDCINNWEEKLSLFEANKESRSLYEIFTEEIWSE